MNLNIEYIKISDIKPYRRNAKLHPDEQIEQIVKSITEFGFNDPIAINGNVIVEGHGRYLAAKKLGLKEVPVIRLDHLSDEQAKAYNLVHNKLTMNSDFDIEILTSELEEIIIDMEQFGFEPTFSIDSMEEIDGYDEVKDKSEFFEKVFTFPRKYKKQIVSYLKKNQSAIIDDIIKKACEGT